MLLRQWVSFLFRVKKKGFMDSYKMHILTQKSIFVKII